MAPELLRDEGDCAPATDVFSFGVVLFEVYSREDPYDGEDVVEVVQGVSDASIGKRPHVPATCPTRVGTMMKECLDESPQSRPTFEEIDLRLQRMSVENVAPAEAHLSVQARRDLKASRANNLLYDVFPPHVAEALRDGRKVEPEHHDMTTIFFSDIVNYTSMVSDMAPTKIAELLDRLYTKFDQLSQKHDVFKVETIG